MIGRQFLHFEIVEKLGEGGMGAVYKAVDQKLGRTVALKFPRLDDLSGPEAKSRFLQEARAASALDHPNIGAIHSVEEGPEGALFIVMAYCDGETLAARLRREPIPVAEAIELAIPIAEGLAEAHAHAIVHRDIKPANILITTRGIPKIVDFGLARKEAGSTTRTLALRGTVAYMSPEQALGREIDHRTDIWSFGITLAEMITGHTPFREPNAPATLYAVVHEPPTGLEAVPVELRAIIFRALAKDAAQRYQTMAELAADLRAIQAHASAPGHPISAGELQARLMRASAPAESRADTPAADGRWAIRTGLVLAAMIVLLAVGLIAWPKITTGARAGYDSYLKGVEYLQRYDRPGNVDKATAAFNEARRADPKSALALAGLADSYLTKYLVEHDARWLIPAQEYCRQASALNKRLAPVYVTQGRIHNGTGKHELAIEEFQTALELDPRNADAVAGLGQAYEQIGRTSDAEEKFRLCVALRPDDWNGYNRLGLFYYRQQRFPEAVAEFEKAIGTTSDNGAAWLNLGAAYTMQRNLPDAERAYTNSVRLAPSYAGYANLAGVYRQRGKNEKAAEAMKQALDLNPKDYRVWTNLGNLYVWTDNTAKAAQAYKRALPLAEEAVTLKPQDPVSRAELASLYGALGTRGKALSTLQAAQALAPGDPRVLKAAIDVYECLGERDQSLHWADEFFKNGGSPDDLKSFPQLRGLLKDPRLRPTAK